MYIIRRKKRKDYRPICTCSVYGFPHRIGGKCRGSTFTNFYFLNIQTLCDECNCKEDNVCEVGVGKESIKEAECYIEAQHDNPGEYLPLEFKEPEDPYDY